MRNPPASDRLSHGVDLVCTNTVARSREIRKSPKLSNVEREVIAAIQSIRKSDNRALHALLYNEPARLMHHFILSTHGHVELRLSCVAQELAVETRTLQRAFRQAFKMSMQQYQIEARLSYAKNLLMTDPLAKMSVIAVLLGYRVTSGFTRFFEKHMKKSPSEWRREQQSRRT